MPHAIKMSGPALRDLDGIPPRYAGAILEFIYSVLPASPRRVGKPLSREFDGLHGARRGDYRVIFEVHDDANDVLVVRVSHRAHAYRSR